MDATSSFPEARTGTEAAALAGLTRQDRLAALLYVGVAVAIGFVDFRIRPGHQQSYAVTTYIPSVLNGTSGAPAMYRLLAPYSIDLFTRVTGMDPLIAFVVSRAMIIYAGLLALHAYARRWYAPDAALGGVLAVAALMPLTFTDGWAHPDTFPELFLFTLGCLLIARRHDALFFVVLVVATLNRETAAFLVLMWGCYRLPDKWDTGYALRLAGYGLTWLSIYAGLRWMLGFQSYEYLMLRENLIALKPVPPGYDPYRRVFGYFWLILLVVPAWLAILGSRVPAAPRFARRALPVAGAFVAVCVLISRVIEARIFVPMFPLLLPAVLALFARPVSET